MAIATTSEQFKRCQLLKTGAQIVFLLAVGAFAPCPLARESAAPPTKSQAKAPASAPQPADMARSEALARHFLSRAADLPISFVLDGKTIRGIPKDWHPAAVHRQIDANRAETVFDGADRNTGLRVRVECTEYRDYPVVEWVAWFANQGQHATPIIRDIQALDAAFQGTGASLYSNNGDFYSEKGYTPHVQPMAAGNSAEFAPNGGRPSNGAFPYYRLMFDKWGLSLAIGWPAEWAAHFEGTADGVQVRAGQQKTNLRINPGEKIRTPRITVLCWSGDASRAVNLWRRWYFAYIMPRPAGHLMRPLMAAAGTDKGEEFTAATEENQIRYIEKWKRLGFDFDVWWIDAGWYPCGGHWPTTGTWEPDPKRFPHGFKPVSECATRHGADLLVWFEPERVRPGTELFTQHSDWLLTLKGNENSLLYLGNPECRRWLAGHVNGLIQDDGIKIYRQDFNFEPLEFWRQNEAEDRQGMNENLHVQGYLQYWDDLRAKNPGLWIDSCASGGRRNDLETMRRAVPLHYTDYGYGIAPVKLSFHQSMFEWLPYFKESTLMWDKGGPERYNQPVDSYSFHCAMAPMLALGMDIKRDDYDWALARKLVAVWRRASDLILYGDYYPHTPFSRTDDKWVAWQFDNPEKGQGFVQGIRLPATPEAAFTVHPRAIDPSATYIFENGETGESRNISGADLNQSGFTLSVPPRNGVIWFYRKVR